jgi:hypothetical protein
MLRKSQQDGLQRAGIPLDKEIVDEIKAASRGLSVLQIGSLLENTVFELDSGGSGYIVSVAIYNDSNRRVRLSEFRLELGIALGRSAISLAK